MAKTVPGFRYVSATSMGALPDVERMAPQVLKRVLERRLAAVESRIRVLSDWLDAAEQRSALVSSWKWSKASMSQGHWSFLADLSYCIAAREALQDALRSL